MKNLDSIESTTQVESENDLNNLLKLIIRNKKIIYISGLCGFIICLLFSLVFRKTWEGEFQIVIADNTKNKISSIATAMENSPVSSDLLQTSGNSIKTEVEILKSPVILNEIFKYVKSKKIVKSNSYNKLIFKDWKKNLNVDLKKGTSVLNISYKDHDKKLVLQVLKKISDAYQEYSGRNRLRNLELGVDFLASQLIVYEKKLENSLTNLNRFSNKYDLISIPGVIDRENSIVNTLDIEKNRVVSSNKIRFLNEQLLKVNSISSDNPDIIYIAEGLKYPEYNSILQNIYKINEDLTFLKGVYKDTDKEIINKKNEKTVLLKILHNKILQILRAKKENNSTLIKVNERPEGTLIKYSQLLNKVNNNQFTLMELNKDFIKLSLDKARYQDPWELITEANLLPYPAFPRKGRVSILGLAIGVMYGILYASYLEKKKDIIYDIKSLETLLNYPILQNISKNEQRKWGKSNELLAKIINKNSYKSIAIYIVDDIDINLVERLVSELSKYLQDVDLKITYDLINALDLSCIIIIGEIGKIKKGSIINLNKNLELQNKILFGMILITP